MDRLGITLGLLACTTASCGQGGAARDAESDVTADAVELAPTEYLDPRIQGLLP